MLFGTILAVLALNPPFCDHAVVQREKTLTVWGEGAVAGERLQLDFAGARTWTKANADGTFRFLVPPQKAGGPFELKVSGAKSGEASAKDVLVGEVWLCSGQSNMAFLMRDAKPGWDDRPDDAQLRCFTVTNRYGFGVSARAEGGWLTATREDVQKFSAVGGCFAAALRRELGVPVGILFASLGGTMVESWTSEASLTKTEAGRRALATYAETLRDPKSWQPTPPPKPWPLDPGPTDETLRWAAADDASTGWRDIPVPSVFEALDNRCFNGAVWYRRDVTIPAGWKGRDLVLDIPAADKQDRTYVNGTLVGATGKERECFHDTPRHYRIPGELTKGGRLRIAVRVWSQAYAGGIVGRGEDLRLKPEGEEGLCLAGTWQAKVELDLGETDAPSTVLIPGRSNAPHALFDAKIAPLVGYGIRGAVWYQGESNQDNADDYHDLLRTMIRDWRTRWGQGDFPFIAVQLANFLAERPYAEEDAWATIRQAMLDLSREEPNVGIASAIDAGDPLNIHPLDKRTVGERLAAWALGNVYGRKDVVPTGPRAVSYGRDISRLIVRFSDCGTGLVGGKDGVVRGVFVRGRDGVGRPASARVLASDALEVKGPVADATEIRYGWSRNPGPIDLRNSAGLPASPFRMKLESVVTPPELPVWPEGKIPGPQTNVVRYAPYYRWWAPTNRLSDAILICCSGGGYHGCCMDGVETKPLVKYFNEKGMNVVEFRYRAPRVDPKLGPKHLLAWQDAQRMIRIVRHEAKKRGLNPDQIGFTGGSAGGHLTIMTAVSSTTNAYELIGDEIDQEPCNVNFAVPVYPAYGMSDKPDGCAPSNDLSIPLVSEFLFDRQTPPMCFFHGADDSWTPMTSHRCWHKLRTLGIPAELHILALEGHVFQYYDRDVTSGSIWKDVLWGWLVRMDLVTKHPPTWQNTWQGKAWTRPDSGKDAVKFSGNLTWRHIVGGPMACFEGSDYLVCADLPEKCILDFEIEVYGKGSSVRFGPTELVLEVGKVPAGKVQRITVTVDGDKVEGCINSRPIPADWFRPYAKAAEVGRHISFAAKVGDSYLQYQRLRQIDLTK